MICLFACLLINFVFWYGAMDNMFERSSLLLGADGIEKLNNSHVWVFGVGGVGGYCAEALVRAGVGSITVVDNDYVSVSNINRQIIALRSTVGMSKVVAFKKRALDINPCVKVTAIHKMYLPSNSDEFDFSKADYVVDCVDNVSAKIELALKASEWNVPVIASMGTGNKLDNTGFEITDIYKTHTDALAKVMRRELKKRGIKKLNVVYSPKESAPHTLVFEGKRPVTASVPWVPPVGGFTAAYKVVSDLVNGGNNNV